MKNLISNFLGLFLVLSTAQIGYGQAVMSMYLSPSEDWKDEFWAPRDLADNPVARDDSDEDWYFDIHEYHVGGQHQGYLAAGFSGLKDFESLTFKDSQDQILTCFSSSDSDVPDCDQFESVGDLKRKHRQMLVFYDLDGGVDNVVKLNEGDLFGVIQDGNYIYVCGTAVNPIDITKSDELEMYSNTHEDHIAGVPIYYNPTTSNQDTFDPEDGFNYDCQFVGAEQFRHKFNVIKMDLSGQVIWNNYYGLPNSLSDAFGKYGIAKMLVVEGNNLLVGGMSYEDEGTFGGSTVNSENKFLISLDKNTGYLNWKMKFDSSEDGMINDIFKDGNEYYVTGYTYQNRNMSDNKDAFIAKVTSSSLSISDFQSPDFRKEGQDYSGSVSIADTLRANSQSAITTSNGDLYWFVMANNNHHFWAGPNIVDGYILELSSSGSLISYEDVGELRAYDMWMTGIPTDDGGFAMVSSRHSPTYFETDTLPGPDTLLGDGTLNTILSCDPSCGAISDTLSSFYEYISTCAYVRKYDSSFDLEWDKIWDSTNNAPRECGHVPKVV